METGCRFGISAAGGEDNVHSYILAIFYPFSQFFEIGIFLLSLQKQPKTAPNLFQRGVEYGKYELIFIHIHTNC